MKKIMLIIIFFILIFVIFLFIKIQNNNYFLGGILHENKLVFPVSNSLYENQNNRYNRPSFNPVLTSDYNFRKIIDDKSILNNIKTPDDLIYNFYGILKEASNMMGYTGGCGTIGNAKTPYSYAYDFLSNNYKKRLTLNQFEDSFKGIGHINLIQLHLISNNDKEQLYIIEIETIEGLDEKCNKNVPLSKTSFVYYYGIINVIKEENGWKIDNIKYIVEDFLCAPYHGWSYDAKYIIEIVYIENLKIIDKIIDYQKEDNIITIKATGNNNIYQFVFIRLTNGYDILLNEYQVVSNQLKKVNLLKGDWSNLKITNN